MQKSSLHAGGLFRKLREFRGMTQETLAAELGINQQEINEIEQSEKVEDKIAAKIANVLGVPGFEEI
jgi:DNA-binding XRE family transcriptional regulator